MRILILCICLILISSCTDKTIYSHSVSFENGTWKNQDPAIFNFSIDETTEKYNLFLDIDHSADYSFENLYVRIKTQFPDQTTVLDTLSIEMIDNQGGWISNCGNDNCELTVFLQQRTMFKSAGDHQISIEQFTRQNDLQGVRSLAFRVGYWAE